MCSLPEKRLRNVTSEVNYACVFPGRVRNFAKYSTAVLATRETGVRRETGDEEETAKIAHHAVRYEIPRRQIMDILPGRKDYYLRMTAISFAVMCTRRLMTGFFVAKNADFLLLVALLLMALPISRRIGGNGGTKFDAAVGQFEGSKEAVAREIRATARLIQNVRI